MAAMTRGQQREAGSQACGAERNFARQSAELFLFEDRIAEVSTPCTTTRARARAPLRQIPRLP